MGITVHASLAYTQEARPFMHFTYLVRGIEEMFLTGRPVSAEEAVRVGLASRICEDVQADALAMATSMAKNSAYATAVTKDLVHKARGRDMRSAIYDNEIRAVCIALHGEYFAKSLAAWRSQILKSK